MVVYFHLHMFIFAVVFKTYGFIKKQIQLDFFQAHLYFEKCLCLKKKSLLIYKSASSLKERVYSGVRL